ncbi:MAG: helicase-associated domain-containing protein [Gemmataceae bacterium]
MPLIEPSYFSERLSETLERYDEPLLRQVVAKLVKPRGQWPTDELIRRMIETTTNAPVIDRRLRELPVLHGQLLNMIGRSSLPRWRVGNLVELIATIGSNEPLRVVLELLEGGLLFPDLRGQVVVDDPDAVGMTASGKLRSFETWISTTTPESSFLFCPPGILARATNDPLEFPDWPPTYEDDAVVSPVGKPRETDGLELLLRMSVLKQQTAQTPLRRTQNGDFFKRDMERLQTGALVSEEPADLVVGIPDIGLLVVMLGTQEGILHEEGGEIKSARIPELWERGLSATMASLWVGVLRLSRWNVSRGWNPLEDAPNPYPSAYLLCMLLLAQRPEEDWSVGVDVVKWITARHPYWTPRRQGTDEENEPDLESSFALDDSLMGFCLGLAYQMRLVEATKNAEDQWLVRLSELGRWLFANGAEPKFPSFPKTLLVQPNLEVLLYRQGLTPELVGRIGQFAEWKGLGAACNLQLQPETVYGALEAGETLDSILQLLDRHGMKPTPPPVIDSLRTWAQKRERLTVYPTGTVLEFPTPEDLTEALDRGVPATRISDNLAVIARESDIDYKHFRLTANRDYTLPPEPCVSTDEDGITLQVDMNRSDLLLESEIGRFADEVPETRTSNPRLFRLTPESIQRAQDHGMTLDGLKAWYLNRTGHSVTAAARLLMTAKSLDSVRAQRLLVIRVEDEHTANGLCEWPDTKALIHDRLGPTALVVEEANLDNWRKSLEALGLACEDV